MRLSTLSWRAVGGLFLGRIACTKTPSTNSWDATRTWKRWPQFFTQVSRTWGPVRPYTTWKTTVILSVLYAQAERHCRGNRTGGTSETLKTAGNKKNEDERCTQSTHVLTVRASIISLKFLFPTILFLIALTESLGLGKKASHPFYC